MIGILTQHRVIHYGSVLQAYALQRILNELGMTNEIIDYKYPNKAHISKSQKTSFRALIYQYLAAFLRLIRNDKNEKSKIEEFINKELFKSKKTFRTPEELAKYCPKYDIYLTGSDQVWNTDYLNGDTSFFFPFAPKDAVKVSYASSFGRFSFSGHKAEEWISNLKSYKSISVREMNAANIIKSYIDVEVTEVLDPTLLIHREGWLDFAESRSKSRKEYILVYLLTYAWDPFPYAEDLAIHYQQKQNYQVKVIEPELLSLNHADWEYVNNVSPHKFVKLFAEASLVITNSFHGVCFSVNMHTPFIPLIRDNDVNDDRLQSLLKKVGLESIGLTVGADYPENTEIDFNATEKLLNELRIDSMNYIIDNIANPHP